DGRSQGSDGLLRKTYCMPFGAEREWTVAARVASSLNRQIESRARDQCIPRRTTWGRHPWGKCTCKMRLRWGGAQFFGVVAQIVEQAAPFLFATLGNPANAPSSI